MLRPHSSLSNALAIGKKKYIWIKTSIVTAAIIGFMIQCWMFFIEYMTYPTAIEISFQNSWEMQFPAITVCNNNRVKYSAWCAYDDKTCETLKIWRRVSRMDSSKTGFPFITESEISEAVKQLYRRLNRETRQQLGVKSEEFIIRCDYDSQNCAQEYSNCYALNVNWGSVYKNNGNKTILTAQKWDPKSDTDVVMLDLILNLQADEYTMESSKSIRLAVHSPDNVPNPTSVAINLRAGFLNRISVTKTRTNLLPPPYATNCQNYTKLRERRTGASQTQENCLDECFWRLSKAACNCTLLRLAILYDDGPQYNTCGEGANIQCLDKDLQEKLTLQCRAKCPMPCELENFEYGAVDFVPWPTNYMDLNILPINHGFNTTTAQLNLVRIRLNYRTMDHLTWNHKPEYPGFKVFSMMGGFVGLWLGVSVATIFDHIVGLIRGAIEFVQHFAETHSWCLNALRPKTAKAAGPPPSVHGDKDLQDFITGKTSHLIITPQTQQPPKATVNMQPPISTLAQYRDNRINRLGQRPLINSLVNGGQQNSYLASRAIDLQPPGSVAVAMTYNRPRYLGTSTMYSNQQHVHGQPAPPPRQGFTYPSLIPY